jgi:TrpR-related protein YerC/YecD
MRVSDRKLNPSLKKQIVKTFNQTLLDLNSEEKLSTFLNDLFTEAEYEVFAKRLAIAYWLKKGRSYNNIKENLKVSSATIASVQSQLNSKGIQLALKQIEAEEFANVWSERIRKYIK